MIRLLMIAAGIVIVLTVSAAIALDPHLWALAAVTLDHRARGAGQGLNARLGTWIIPSPAPRIAGRP